MSFLLGEVGTGANEAVQAAKTVLEGVTGTMNITNVVSILGIGIAAAIGLVLLWWGARKLVRVVMGAFRKGKISF